MSKRQYGMLIVVALVAGLVGGVGASWVLISRPVYAKPVPQPAKVIRAEKVEIVDKYGKVRALLGTEDGGKPTLSFVDENGKPLAVLVPDGLRLGDPTEKLHARYNSDGLEIDDENGKLRFALTVHPMVLCGSPCLVLVDKAGKTRALLRVAADGSPSLELADQEEKTRATLLVQPDGSPSLKLADQEETQRADLTVFQGEPRLVLLGKDRKVIWEAP